jgi:hypothetical protein
MKYRYTLARYCSINVGSFGTMEAADSQHSPAAKTSTKASAVSYSSYTLSYHVRLPRFIRMPGVVVCM